MASHVLTTGKSDISLYQYPRSQVQPLELEKLKLVVQRCLSQIDEGGDQLDVRVKFSPEVLLREQINFFDRMIHCNRLSVENWSFIISCLLKKVSVETDIKKEDLYDLYTDDYPRLLRTLFEEPDRTLSR